MTSWVQFLRTSVRGRLVFLVLAIAVPAVLLVGLLVAQAYRHEREAIAEHLAGAARTMALLVDRQIGANEALLKGLATARELEMRNFDAFDVRARSVLTAPDCWIVLADETGQQLVNTRLARGPALPRQTLDGEFATAVRAGRTYISNVVLGSTLQRPVLFVSVPVLESGRLQYVLSFATLPETFARALEVERFSADLTTTILDRQGTIAARSPGGERFVGQKAPPDLMEAMLTQAEGIREITTLDGGTVMAAHSRAAVSGWSVALGIPYSALHASARQLLWTGLGLSVVLMLIAIAMAGWIGRALVRSVDTLVADTDALGRGEVPAPRASGLAETDFVAEAMRKTARHLHEREKDNAALTAALQEELAKQKHAEELTCRLAAIVESSDDAIVSKDLRGIVTSWNRGAERLFGYTAAEMVGQPVTLLIPADRQSEEAAILEHIRRGERVEHFETLRRRKDGRLVPVSLTISPVHDAQGVVLGASKIARDVSQRRRSEAQQHALYELAASVNRTEALPEVYAAALAAICRSQETERTAILRCDAEGKMRFEAARGLSEEYQRQVEGHSPWEVSVANPQSVWIDDVAHATLAPELRAALEREGIRALAFIPLTFETKLLGKFMIYYDAPHRFTAAELRPVEAIASQVAFSIERRRSAEALEALVAERTASLRQAVVQMEEFSYSVSHDLRAPVRAMCGFAEAILQDHAAQLDEHGRHLLTRILRNGARMDRLIQDLLTYSRISRRDISFEPVSMDKLLREVVQQYPDLRPERVDIEVQGPLPDVIAHEPSLTQVVTNLLSNAVKFMPPQARPRVRVGFERGEKQVRLWFKDNGIGIKPEYQSRVFGMFERVHPDKNYEGTGIGLAIVRKAVERMHGAVGVESDGVSGSKFWFELPAATQSET